MMVFGCNPAQADAAKNQPVVKLSPDTPTTPAQATRDGALYRSVHAQAELLRTDFVTAASEP